MRRSVSIAKRILDVAASSFGLAVTLPFYPVIAAAIYRESPGPIFFRQRRAGELLGSDPGSKHQFRFKEFEMFKFRTMRPDAEANTGAVLSGENDDRVTRVGTFLRRSRLDELPQLWNVLRGEMSLVGPRPERPELLKDLAVAIPFFEERTRGVKPGLTGLAQISLGYTGRPSPGSELAQLHDSLSNPFKVPGAEGALADDMRMKLLYDCAYGMAIENFSSFVRMELSILAKTPLVMFKRLGR